MTDPLPRTRPRWWRYFRGLAPAAILFALMIGILVYAQETRLRGEMEFEESIIKEWVLETRVGPVTLAELVRQYLSASSQELAASRDAVRSHLTVLGDITRVNQGLLPLFPFIYRLELQFDPPVRDPVAWDAHLPLPREIKPQRYDLLDYNGTKASLVVYLQLRAFANRPEEVARRQAQVRHGLLLIAIAAAGVALLWITLFLRHERAEELKEYRAKEQFDTLERRRLQEQLRREEEELKRREAEKQVLEARTKLYADISVLAGSYAHNIKNLLVRPNDLLDRCLNEGNDQAENRQMLAEARESLRAVSERTQQILRTVRRDLKPPQPQQIDLNEVAAFLHRQWHTLAEQQWKLSLRVVPSTEPVFVQGDVSHLQQALENLLCNSRDATFEQRNHLRDLARSNGHVDAIGRQALLAAAAWRGEVTVRVSRQGEEAVISVHDNGIGMSEEVLRRCTEAHFTTKRDNALHEGLATGMGLGLSFVAWVVDQHHGKLEINSRLHDGTTVSICLPAVSRENKPTWPAA